MRKLAFITERYDRGFGHWTTRQNLQLNWMQASRTRPTSSGTWPTSRCTPSRPRATACATSRADPYAGVAPDELFDRRAWCEMLRQYTTLHPEFMYLPRKFKIAVTRARPRTVRAATADPRHRRRRRCGATTASFGWRVFVGGGLGRTPRVGQVCSDGAAAR
jgi:sulfite reductase (NADPH) hemoprotein beta-component